LAIGQVYWRNSEEEAARIIRICERLGPSKFIIDELKNSKDSFLAGEDQGAEEASEWQKRLSTSDRQLISIARALSYNPEVLVMNRPTAQLSEGASKKVFELLTEFTRNRGVELPKDSVSKRRPRTAFISFIRMTGVAIADRVWNVEDGSVTELDKANVSTTQVV